MCTNYLSYYHLSFIFMYMKHASSSRMCFYDAGHLPGFDVLGENAEEKWSRDTRGSGQGEVRDADGTVGVGCYEMVVEEAVSFFLLLSSSFFFFLLLLLLLPDQGAHILPDPFSFQH